MKVFRFHLEKVLEWRALQLRAAEEKLTQLQHELASLATRAQALLADYRGHAGLLIAAPTIEGFELNALAVFGERINRLRQALRTQKAQCEALIAEQRRHLLKARSDHRMLEKLRERQLRSWEYLADRETENQAAEAHLSNWVRGASEENARSYEQDAAIRRGRAGL